MIPGTIAAASTSTLWRSCAGAACAAKAPIRASASFSGETPPQIRRAHALQISRERMNKVGDTMNVPGECLEVGITNRWDTAGAISALRRASVYFDGDMREPAQAFEPLFVDRGRLRPIGNNGCDHRGMARAKLPEMEIDDPVAVGFDSLADASLKFGIRHRIQQHAAGGADKAQRPRCDHYRADKSHRRIHETPFERPCR